MKKNILIVLLLILSLLFISVGCANKDNKSVVNCGDEVDLTEFFGEEDSLLNAKFYDVNGKEIPIGNGIVYLNSLGEYKLVLKSGTTYVFSCEDLEGPIAALKDQPNVVYRGDSVSTETVFYDKAGSTVSSYELSVTYCGQSVEVADGKFIASERGDYLVTVNATDANGNSFKTEITVESIETVYGKGIYVMPEQDDAAVIVHREKYTDGENAGKYRTVIRKDFYDTGFGYLTIKATKDAGLKPNTYYGLTLRVDSEHDGWCYYNPDNEWLTKKSSPTVNFTVKTDENGEYFKRWWTYHSYSSYFDFSSVTFHEYVYGQGVDLVIKPVNTVDTVLSDQEILTGDNAGKYIKMLTVNKGNFFTMTITASAEAQLKANQNYMVNMTIDTDGAYPAVYEIHTNDGQEINDWFIDKDNSLLSFIVNTDQNGVFTKTYRVYVRGVSSFVKFANIEFLPFSGYAYGQGVSLEITPKEGLKVNEELLDKTANDGIFIKKLNRISSDFATLKVYVSSDAGLSANSEYKLTITAQCDGEYPAYYQPNDEWFIDKEKTQITATVYTDENGEFEIKWNTYFNKGTYVRFTDVSLEKQNSAYPLGVHIMPICGFGTVSEEPLSSGEDIGKKIIVINKESDSEGATKLTVSAVKAAGFKANTTYTVTMRIDTDKDSFWAYYCTDNTWLVKQSSPYATFEVTTDDNGEFIKTFNSVYFGKNCTYAKFSSIVFEEKN